MKLDSSEAPRRLGELALLAAAFLVPLAFYLRNYDSAAVKLAAAQWGALALALAWVWQGLSRGRWQLSAESWKILAPALLYGVWSAGRFIAADYKAGAFPAAVDQWALWTVFLAGLTGLAGARAASRLALFSLLAGWLVALYAVLQAAGFDPFLWRGAFGEGPLSTRAFSSMANPVYCAAYLAFMPPLALTYAQDPETPPLLRGGALALIPVAAAATLLTQAPEGLVAFAVVNAVFGALYPLAAGARAALRAGAVAFVVAAATLSAAWGAGLFSASPAGTTTPRRWTHAEKTRHQALIRSASWRLAAERPLVGHGPGSFSLRFPVARPLETIRLEGKHNTFTDHPESSWLTALVELGWPGALLWAWMWGAALWAGLSGAGALRRAGAPAESAYAAGFSAAAAGALAAAQLSSSWEYVAVGWLPWTLGGLGAGLAALAARRAPVSVWPLPVSPAVRRALHAPGLLVFAALAAPPALWLKADADHNAALFYAKHGDYDRAVALWEKIPRGSPLYAVSLYFRGNARLDEGRAEDALAYYDRLRAEAAPDFVQVHHQRGVALAKLGRWEEAAIAHARQADLDPLFIPNLARWAEAARAAGNLDEARRAVALAQAEAPGDDRIRVQDAANDAHERRLAAERGRVKNGGKGVARRPR